jgi:hypothetical protein
VRGETLQDLYWKHRLLRHRQFEIQRSLLGLPLQMGRPSNGMDLGASVILLAGPGGDAEQAVPFMPHLGIPLRHTAVVAVSGGRAAWGRGPRSRSR